MWSDFKKVSKEMNKSDIGSLFEVISRLVFEEHDVFNKKIKNVWYRSEVPEEIRDKYELYMRDVGMDMIIESQKDIYAVQCKYKNKRGSTIYENDIKTFRTELKRTGMRGILISNAENYEDSILEDERITTMGEYFTDEMLDYDFFSKIHNKYNGKEIYDSHTTEWMRNLDKIDDIINSKKQFTYDEKKKLDTLNRWYYAQVWKMMRTIDKTVNRTIIVRPYIHEYWADFCKKNYGKIKYRYYGDILDLCLVQKSSKLLKHDGYIEFLYKPEQ